MAKIDLAAVVAATLAGNFLYASEKDAKKLLADGFVEMNTAMANPANDKEFAIRATQQGIAAMNTTNEPEATTTDFAFVTGPALDKPKRTGSGRTSRFPFENWPAPDAAGNTAKIFVAATDKVPEPWKSLVSTISAANRRFAEVTGTKPGKNKNGEEIERNVYKFTRKFVLVKGEHNGKNGAWIERVL